MARHVIRLQPGPGRRLAHACVLLHGDTEIRLAPGEYVLGRDGACHIQLADPRVSRRHARLVVRKDGATIEDLGSSNGVYLNGERISHPRNVEDDDVVFMGDDEIRVRLGDVVRKARQWTPSLEDLSGEDAVPPEEPTVSEIQARPISARRRAEPHATDRVDALEMLGHIAEKSIALGRVGDAEKMLAGHLDNVLSDARAGRGILPENRETAARFALKLACASARAKWFDYVIELHAALAEPCADSLIVEIQVALNKVEGIDVGLLRRHVEALRSDPSEHDSERNRLVQRMEEILQMALARTS